MAMSPYFNDNRGDRPMILGEFQESVFGHHFNYAVRSADDMKRFAPGLPHLVFVGPTGETRAALVMKTVAYIAVDEGEGGKPINEKWKIKKHRRYGA